jgi:hypothetical protein
MTLCIHSPAHLLSKGSDDHVVVSCICAKKSGASSRDRSFTCLLVLILNQRRPVVPLVDNYMGQLECESVCRCSQIRVGELTSTTIWGSHLTGARVWEDIIRYAPNKNVWTSKQCYKYKDDWKGYKHSHYDVNRHAQSIHGSSMESVIEASAARLLWTLHFLGL